MTLLDISLHSIATVLKINADLATVHHIQSLGIIEQEQIVCIGRSPLGNPRIYKCLETMVAVRDDLARCVEVEIQGDSDE